MTGAPLAPKRKRAWFQLHLSTCVALMCVAGVLVWVNVVPHERQLPNQPRKGQEPPYDVRVVSHGWPISAEWKMEDGWPAATFYAGDAVDRNALFLVVAVNGAAALALLALTAGSCEFLIRRRARRRDALDSAP
ncbi:MAG: hypothetical protein L6R28_23640 [Planctomycetes bacterium]|nr:hypothetical protein [Planctomycetota bacterium]